MKDGWKRLLHWSLLLACTAFIVYFFSTHRDELRVLGNIRARSIVCLLALTIVYLLVHGMRFKIVLEECSGRAILYWPWFRALILSRFFSIFMPQLGSIYRGVYLKRQFQVSYTRYIGGFCSFAWMDTCFNLLLTLVVVRLANPGLRLGAFSFTSVVGVLLLLIVTIPIVVERVFRAVKLRGRRLLWLHSKLSEVLEVSVRNLRHGAYMVKFVFLGLLTSGLVIVLLYACFRGMGLTVGWSETVLFYVVLKLSSHVAVTPGNLGVLEIAFGILGEQMQIGMGEGILASAIMRVVGYLALGLLSMPLGIWDALSRREASQRGRNGVDGE